MMWVSFEWSRFISAHLNAKTCFCFEQWNWFHYHEICCKAFRFGDTELWWYSTLQYGSEQFSTFSTGHFSSDQFVAELHHTITSDLISSNLPSYGVLKPPPESRMSLARLYQLKTNSHGSHGVRVSCRCVLHCNFYSFPGRGDWGGLCQRSQMSFQHLPATCNIYK